MKPRYTLTKSFNGFWSFDPHLSIKNGIGVVGEIYTATKIQATNEGHEPAYVGDETHTDAVQLIAKGHCLIPQSQYYFVRNPERIVLYAPNLAQIKFVMEYESKEIHSDFLTIDQCRCDFYSVILASGCQCGGQ